MIKLAGLEPHPLALIFPALTEDRLAELACDIRDHGLIEPITLSKDHRVLDGRSRVEACKRAGLIEIPFLVFEGNEAQAQAFVYAKNMLRRQLTDDQRAGIAARFATMSHGGDRSKPPVGGLPVAAAASQAGVSKRTVERAKAVDKQAPALMDEVIAGTKKLAVARKEAATKKPTPHHRPQHPSKAKRRGRLNIRNYKRIALKRPLPFSKPFFAKTAITRIQRVGRREISVC
jgi:hypothetical protein